MKNVMFVISLMFSTFCLFAQEATINIQHEGQQRSFIIYSPCGTYNCGNKLLPVVFVFHGLGQSAEEIKDYSLFNNIADTAGFVAVYPEGINNGWNVGFSLGNPTSTDDVDFTETIIQYLINNMANCTGSVCVNVDTNRIYSCGMSNGGFMSYQLACSLSNRIEAIASVTGSMTNTMYDNCNPSKPIPLLEIHGDADLVVPYTGSALTGAKPISQVLSFWVNQNNCPANSVSTNVPDIVNTDSSTVTEYSYKPCTDSEILHFKVLGGGHCWPGSATAPGLGPTNMDINASTEIWKFFSRYGTPVTLGINEQTKPVSIRIVPNPSNGKFSIELPNELFNEVNLFDVNGRLVVSERIINGETSPDFDWNYLERGIYFLKANNSKHALVERIVIQ